MNRYFIIDLLMVMVSCYVVYGIGNYQLFPNIPEVNAMVVCIFAMMFAVYGIFNMTVKIIGYLNARK